MEKERKKQPWFEPEEENEEMLPLNEVLSHAIDEAMEEDDEEL